MTRGRRKPKVEPKELTTPEVIGRMFDEYSIEVHSLDFERGRMAGLYEAEQLLKARFAEVEQMEQVCWPSGHIQTRGASLSLEGTIRKLREHIAHQAAQFLVKDHDLGAHTPGSHSDLCPKCALGKFTIPNPADDIIRITGYGGGGSSSSRSDEKASPSFFKRSDLEGATITVGKEKK